MSKHSARKQLFRGPSHKPTWAGLKDRSLDDSGIEVRGSIALSNTSPIVSVQDGPRMSLKNFGGKKATPFTRGKKRRSKVLMAKTAMKRNAALMALKKGK